MMMVVNWEESGSRKGPTDNRALGPGAAVHFGLTVFGVTTQIWH